MPARRTLRLVALGAVTLVMPALFARLSTSEGCARGVLAAVCGMMPVLVVAVVAFALLLERLRGRFFGRCDVGAAVAGGLAMVAMMMPVVDTWARGTTNGSQIGGLLPYSDGRGYHLGAIHLLHEGVLDIWNSRRALNPAFLAGRLALTSGSFRGALLIQAAFAGGSAYLAGRAVGQDLGFAAGSVTYAVLALFGMSSMATVWTEPLGLTLGSLALAALWHASRTKSAPAIAAGFALMWLAQSARAGAMFAAPLLVWWAWRLPGGAGHGRWKLAGAALGGLAIAWACNRAVTVLNGGDTKASNGAFAYTLYGLAQGGTNWGAVFHDHPEMAALASTNDAEAARQTYALAFEEIRRHPTGLLRGLWDGVELFVYAWTEALSGGLLYRRPALQWLYFCVLALGVAAMVRRLRRVHGRKDPALSMVLVACVGMLASIPVIYADGSERVFAATIPFLAALAAFAVVALKSSPKRASPGATHARRWVLPALLGVSVVVVCIVGPRVGRRTFGGWLTPAAATKCGEGEDLRIVVGMPASPKLDLVQEGAPTYAPTVAVDAFRRGIRRSHPSSETLTTLQAGTTVALAYDLLSKDTMFVTGPAGWLRDGQTVAICTRKEGLDLHHIVSAPAPSRLGDP